MRTRPSLILSLVLAVSACRREPEPEPVPTATAQNSATSATEPPTSVAVSAALPVLPSRHGSDLPDTPVAHPPPDNAKQIRASHILIAYKGAKGADPKVSRSRAEAKALAEHVDIEARAGADFKELVAKYSDDPTARSNHGDLGLLTRTSLEKPFTDAAFGLLKQEIGYDPVETAFGFHIIKRTE